MDARVAAYSRLKAATVAAYSRLKAATVAAYSHFLYLIGAYKFTKKYKKKFVNPEVEIEKSS